MSQGSPNLNLQVRNSANLKQNFKVCSGSANLMPNLITNPMPNLMANPNLNLMNLMTNRTNLVPNLANLMVKS